MKKQATTDAKKAAANDKENGNGKAKAKSVKPCPVDEKYTIGSTETMKRGFLKEFCDFARKKGTVDAAIADRGVRWSADRRAQNRCSACPPIHSLRAQSRPTQDREMSGIKFSPRTVVATPGVLAEFTASGDDPLAFLVKHIAGDWGEVGKEDWNANEWRLAHGERLLSVYTMSNGTRFWIITERDRSSTWFLLPEEY